MYFERQGTEVILKINSETGVEKCMFGFKYECGDEATAEIFRKHFQKLLDKNAESIKGKFYNMGHKDGRQKKIKLW